jgi:hypothetical protein
MPSPYTDVAKDAFIDCSQNYEGKWNSFSKKCSVSMHAASMSFISTPSSSEVWQNHTFDFNPLSNMHYICQIKAEENWSCRELPNVIIFKHKVVRLQVNQSGQNGL